MRGKLAKRLRRLAEDATQGLPAAAYRRAKHRRGSTQSHDVSFGNFMMLHMGCTRATYKRLKAHKKARRPLGLALRPLVAAGLAGYMGTKAQAVLRASAV